MSISNKANNQVLYMVNDCFRWRLYWLDWWATKDGFSASKSTLIIKTVFGNPEKYNLDHDLLNFLTPVEARWLRKSIIGEFRHQRQFIITKDRQQTAKKL